MHQHAHEPPTHLQGFSMNSRQLLSSALASVLAMGLVQSAAAHEGAVKKDKEKCYGIAKTGENNCANLSGSHSCAGEATQDSSAVEWKLVAKGSCAKLGGLTSDQAKAALAKAGEK
jgi:uncharacterized membrane protein